MHCQKNNLNLLGAQYQKELFV